MGAAARSEPPPRLSARARDEPPAHPGHPRTRGAAAARLTGYAGREPLLRPSACEGSSRDDRLLGATGATTPSVCAWRVPRGKRRSSRPRTRAGCLRSGSADHSGYCPIPVYRLFGRQRPASGVLEAPSRPLRSTPHVPECGSLAAVSSPPVNRLRLPQNSLLLFSSADQFAVLVRALDVAFGGWGLSAEFGEVSPALRSALCSEPRVAGSFDDDEGMMMMMQLFASSP
ncbi:hypothetical protein U9M48_018182 [Paspalum notatum var. saurae]|uniref:Uncharacterized protein n=1 Tax=Paspalum notatum var. saurae TaxID=547442 RepID=A0AAQ3WPH8_PASNO